MYICLYFPRPCQPCQSLKRGPAPRPQPLTAPSPPPLRSAFYTGVMGAHLKRVTGQFTLAGGQRDTLTLRLDASEYQDRLVDMGFIKVTASGFVNENKQSYIDEHDFQFEKPRMSIEVRGFGRLCRCCFVIRGCYCLLSSSFASFLIF